MKKNVAFITGAAFLLIQVFSIIYAQFIPERFFCWAPYDQHTYYEVQVQLKDSFLTTDAVKKRYGYKAKGWEPRDFDNIISIINQYERSYGSNDDIKVSILYSINGRPKEIWRLEK